MWHTPPHSNLLPSLHVTRQEGRDAAHRQDKCPVTVGLTFRTADGRLLEAGCGSLWLWGPWTPGLSCNGSPGGHFGHPVNFLAKVLKETDLSPLSTPGGTRAAQVLSSRWCEGIHSKDSADPQVPPGPRKHLPGGGGPAPRGLQWCGRNLAASAHPGTSHWAPATLGEGRLPTQGSLALRKVAQLRWDSSRILSFPW